MIKKPPSQCDLCAAKIVDTFYDAATKWGQWGNVCPKCFVQGGMTLGTGRGQEYKKQTDGTFKKTRG
jgi:hypothetical protein